MNVEQFKRKWFNLHEFEDFEDDLEELINECYRIGYEDGKIDFQESKPFVAYGKFEDFHD